MTADDKLIYAQAKDTIEATKEFEAAVAEGKAAALQEQVSGDSQSFICPITIVIHSSLNYSFQDFPRFYSSTGKNQDQDGGTHVNALSLYCLIFG